MEQHLIEKGKKNKQKLVKIFAGIGLIVALATIFIWKANSDNFSTKTLIILIGLSIIVFTIVFFIFEIPNIFKRKKEEITNDKKVPNAITIEEADKRIDKILLNDDIADYIDTTKDVHKGTEEHGRLGNQTIYFKDYVSLYGEKSCFIAINLHYPEHRWRHAIEPNASLKERIKRRLATDPEPPSDKEIIIESNPLLGTERKTTKTSHKKDEPKKEIKEDLA